MNKYFEYHLNKYPNMQIEDKVKLLMQANLGCGHLVKDYQIVLNRVMNELNTIISSNDEMIEEISDNYIRIYLKPYYDKHHSFDELIKMFMESSKEPVNIPGLVNDLIKLKEILNDEDRQFVNDYLERKDYLISHSQTYRDIYNPHYLVIHKKYYKEA